MKRIHTTDNELLDLGKKYAGQRNNGKPNGLWYTNDYSWHQWCKDADFGKPCKYDFTLDLDMSDILFIDNLNDLSKLKIIPFGYDSKISMGFLDWEHLFSQYKGFEVPNQSELKQRMWGLSGYGKHGIEINMSHDMFICGLDCDGGCMWDLSAIKSVKRKERSLE